VSTPLKRCLRSLTIDDCNFTWEGTPAIPAGCEEGEIRNVRAVNSATRLTAIPTNHLMKLIKKCRLPRADSPIALCLRLGNLIPLPRSGGTDSCPPNLLRRLTASPLARCQGTARGSCHIRARTRLRPRLRTVTQGTCADAVTRIRPATSPARTNLIRIRSAHRCCRSLTAWAEVFGTEVSDQRIVATGLPKDHPQLVILTNRHGD
jgi:hypothetical protein